MAKIDLLIKKQEKGDPPFPTIVHLFLREYASDKEGNILLSNEIMSAPEATQQINILIKQLSDLHENIIKIFER